MPLKIRDLLDALEGDALRRLCDIRTVSGRSLDARREALARSYRGDQEAFLSDLRKEDLVVLLSTSSTTIDGVEYYLPRARSYSLDELIGIARKAFFREVVPSELEALEDEDEDDEDEDHEDEDEDHEDDEDEDEDEDHEGDEDDPRSGHHEQWLRAELTYSPHEATAKRAHPYQVEAESALLGSLCPERPQLLHLATGGGKTLVANNVIARWIERHGGPVLWVTKDWRLLMQAARDLRRRHETVSLPTRVGGDGKMLHPLEEAGPSTTGVVYTTIHTLLRRLNSGARRSSARRDVLRTLRPTLLVWDESHWGEHSGTGHIVTACSRAKIPVLGLTATPRHDTRYHVAFSRTYQQLVSGGYLAKQVVLEQHTGVAWTPVRQRLGDRSLGDITQASLQELAGDTERNNVIVRHYLDRVAVYGKTIVFACTVDHATKLAALFLARGVAARPVHHQQADSDVRDSLDMFRTGQVQVLVNVAMLTHGIDVPDARTVFLCRPTTSDILFAQMIGRACRRDEASGKTTFNVVEFTDNVSQFADLFQSSKKFFQGAAGVHADAEPRSRSGPGPRREKHAFDPTGAATWMPEEAPEVLRGLWYRQGRPSASRWS